MAAYERNRATTCDKKILPVLVLLVAVIVVLTTLAVFFPMLFVTSEQANFLVPMALALSFGLIFGVVSTLVLTPVCYAVLKDMTDYHQRRFVNRSPTEPADK